MTSSDRPVPDSPGAHLRPIPAYEELTEKIRQRIEFGELPVGTRIPSEIALARDEQVSRSTVREALRTLEEAGVLQRTSPKILVVKSTGEDIAFKEFNRALERRSVRFRDVYEALLVLEPAMVRYATERATPDDIAALRRNVELQASSTHNPLAWNDASLLFHRQLAEMARNPALFVARASLSALLRPAVRSIYNAPTSVHRIYELNLAIADEIAAGDPEGAAYAARKGILHFGRSWTAAGNDLDDLVNQLPPDTVKYATNWDD